MSQVLPLPSPRGLTETSHTPLILNGPLEAPHSPPPSGSALPPAAQVPPSSHPSFFATPPTASPFIFAGSH